MITFTETGRSIATCPDCDAPMRRVTSMDFINRYGEGMIAFHCGGADCEEPLVAQDIDLDYGNTWEVDNDGHLVIVEWEEVTQEEVTCNTCEGLFLASDTFGDVATCSGGHSIPVEDGMVWELVADLDPTDPAVYVLTEGV